MISQKEALCYVCNQKNGLKSHLINVIGIEMTKEFELVGFIQRGFDGDAQETWKAAPFANSHYDSIYGKPSLNERLKEYFCHYILRV